MSNRETNPSSLLDHDGQLYRSSDPATSKKAAYDVAPRANTQRMRALRALLDVCPNGLTYAQVAYITEIRAVWKRLSELKQGGWIEVAGERIVPETGSLASVYVASDKAREMFGE